MLYYIRFQKIKIMAQHRKISQGTLNSIIALVLFFLIIDIIIAFIMFFKIDLNQLFENINTGVNTDNVVNVSITDNVN